MKKYKVIKVTNINKIEKINSEINGFDVSPKNKINKKNTIRVSKAKISDEGLIKCLINKKIDKKYSKIYQMVTDIVENDDDEDGTKMGILLNEIELFRSILKHKYAKYMEMEEYNSLENRMRLMEKEIKRKLMEIEEEKMSKKSAGRHR